MEHRAKRLFSAIMAFVLLAGILVGGVFLSAWCTEKDAYFQKAEAYPLEKLRFLATEELVELTLHTFLWVNSSYAPETPREYYDLWKAQCHPLQELARRTDAAQALYQVYLKEEVVFEKGPTKAQWESDAERDEYLKQRSRWRLRRVRLYSLELLLSQHCYRNQLSEEQQEIITRRVAENRKEKKAWSRENPEDAYIEVIHWWGRNPEATLYPGGVLDAEEEW